MRAILNGMISFGLVNIPIRLYAAVEAREFELNLLHESDLCPVHYKKVCSCDGKELKQQEIVKGYQYEKGDYVVLKDEDFEKAEVPRSQAIEIEVFVDEKEVDPIFLEKSYYLEPEKKAHKPYALFRDALLHAKKVGIGKFTLKNREHLVMLKAEKNVILLVILRFASLIRDPGSLDLPGSIKIPANQMELALELIKKLEGAFKPDQFKDNYAETLRKIVEAKKKGKTVHVKKPVMAETDVNDIMTKLKESLAAAHT